MGKLISLLSIFLVLVVITSVMFISKDILTKPQAKPTKIDSFMTNAKFSQYTDSGQIHFILMATHMRHYNKNDTAYFTAPRLHGYTAERVPWSVASKYGKTIKGTQQLNFWNNVILEQSSYPHHPSDTVIHTSAITIYPNRSYAETDQAVTIIRPNSTANGVGMQTNFKTGIMQLMSQAKVEYNPKANAND